MFCWMANNSLLLKRGTIWTAFNKLSIYGMQFIAMIVLARKLMPHDFAVMGIISFFIGISQILLDSGMGGALLKKKDIAAVDYSTLFLFNFSMSALLYVVFYIASPCIALFYMMPELEKLIKVSMLSIIISSLGQVQYIMMLRELKFKHIALISIIASCISLLTAVILAHNGFGVWALVFQNLILQFFIVSLQFMYNRFIPKMSFSFSSFIFQWKFGVYLFLSSLLTSIYQNLFSLIFPKISSFAFSGLYTQANKIQQIPVNIVNSSLSGAAFPILAKIENENNFVAENRAYSRKVFILFIPLMLYISIFSKELIFIVLGDKWIEAKFILSVLSFGAIAYISQLVIRNAIKSLGVTKYILFIELCNTILSLLFLFVLYRFGTDFIIIGIVVSQYFAMLLSMFLLSKLTPYHLLDQLKDFFFILFPLLVPFIIVLLLKNKFVIGGTFTSLFFYSLLFILLLLFVDIVFLNKNIINLGRSMFKGMITKR